MTDIARVGLIAIVAGCLVAAACDALTGDPPDSSSALYGLHRVSEHAVVDSVREPSDLAFDPATNSFWTVSDANGSLYRISADGAVLAGPLTIKANDLEGIAFDPKTSHLFVADEQKNEILEVTKEGTVLGKFDVPGGKGNNGIEGIAYDPTTDGFVVVNERKPTELIFITRDGKTTGRVTVQTQDLSAVATRPDGAIFVMGRFEESVLEVDRKGRILNRLNVNAPGIEGLAFDDRGRLFAVADLGKNVQGRLYLYAKDGGR